MFYVSEKRSFVRYNGTLYALRLKKISRKVRKELRRVRKV